MGYLRECLRSPVKPWGRAALSISACGLLLGGAACTSIENDPSTHDVTSAFTTQIDFQPPSREERIRRIGVEERIYQDKTKPLLAQKDQLEAERLALYKEVESEFPECGRQKHCNSKMVRGDVKKFERYNQISVGLREIDRKIIDVEADLAQWKYRHDLRVRALYNRYLVHEFLKLPKQTRDIPEVTVHSLEKFNDRKSLSYRLLRYSTDKDFYPSQVGDLDFRMLGKAVDEAAVIATFYITARESLDPSRKLARYLVTFLINTHQLDSQFYERDFFAEWATLLTEDQQKKLREKVLCTPYSIASNTLAPKMSPGKVKPCAEARAIMQAKRDIYTDRMDPTNWMVPVTYFRFPE
jgi:hypothetical protein